LNHSASPFCAGYFRDRVSWTICLGWLRTMILLISAFWVARITGLSHPCQASQPFLSVYSSHCCLLVQFWKIWQQFKNKNIWTQSNTVL
jgi:hypothetical protein